MKNPSKKLFVECTYTHASDLNTGIQRVVRKLVTLLPDIAKEYHFDVHLVILQNDKFVEIDTLNSIEANKSRNRKQLTIRALRQAYYLSRKGVATLLPHPTIKHFLFATRSEFGLNYLIDQYVIRNIRKVKVVFSPASKLDSTQQPLRIKAHAGDILLLLDSSWHMDIWSAVEQLRKQGVKPVVITYDLIPILYPQFLNEALVYAFSNWFKQASHHCDGFISISKTVQTEVEEQLSATPGINVSDKFTGHFTLGADFLATDGEPKKVRKQLVQMFPNTQLSENSENTYLTVGTIEPRKNHKYLLDAFDQLWEQGFNMKLCCVGKCGWKNSDILARIKNHKRYGKNLFLWNDLNDDELAFCYKNSQMLLFASHAEGFGLPIIEGLYFGLPVMASDIPVHREVGKDQVEYFDLADPADLIEKIVCKEKESFSDSTDSTSTFHRTNWEQSGRSLMDEIIAFDISLDLVTNT